MTYKAFGAVISVVVGATLLGIALTNEDKYSQNSFIALIIIGGILIIVGASLIIKLPKLTSERQEQTNTIG